MIELVADDDGGNSSLNLKRQSPYLRDLKNGFLGGCDSPVSMSSQRSYKKKTVIVR